MDKVLKLQKTLTFIKPHAVKAGHLSAIRKTIKEQEGISVLRERYCYLTKEGVEYHYRNLKETPFFKGLVIDFTGRPIYVMELAGENVITRFREIIGNTDPKKCSQNQLRAIYGKDIQDNALHASDSPEAYEDEARMFFGDREIPYIGECLTPFEDTDLVGSVLTR